MVSRNTVKNELGNSLTNPMKSPLWTAVNLGGQWIGEKVGKQFGVNNQTSTPSIQTNKPVQKQTVTYDPRYPGFDEEDYLRLEQIVDSFGETGSKKAQLMDEAYQTYYPQVLNKHKLDERQENINNWVYENGEKLANGDTITNAQYRLLNLTQMAKEKFDIAYNVDDAKVINNIVEKVPNGQELLTKFLNSGDPEILYASGIYDKGQEAQDFRSQKDIANEVLGGNFWKNAWNNMYANSFAPLDAVEKFTYKGIKNLQMLGTKIDDYFADKNIPEFLRKDAFGDKTAEEIRTENQEFRDTSKREIDDYINLVNNANQTNRERTVNPIVDNYYSRRNFTDLLAEGDIDGFFYKGLGDAASNRDMPIIIGASIVTPGMGTALMATNSYVRESEEAYETMRKAGATHEQAEKGAAVVGIINSAIEVYLDKLLGGTETTTSKGVREAIKKNVLKEVTNKPFEEIMSSAVKTYAGSSLEEGLEEWLQNIVTNAAEMTVKENPEWKDLFEGGRAAAEGGIFNPFNVLAPAGDIARNTDINQLKQSMNEGAYNLGVDLRNLTNPDIDSELLTRTIPEKVVEGGMKLTPTERARVEQTGITPANFILSEGLAGLDNQDKIIQLANIGAEGYNNVTNTFKEVIPDTEKIESKEAQKMLNIMAKVIENSDILSEEYADYLQTIKKLAEQTEFDPYTALAIKRDFDALAGHDLYNSKGQVMKNVEKETIAGWRAGLNEKLNELGDKYGVDVRKENQRVMNSITIRDGLLRAMSQNKKNNFLGLGDLGFGALLSSGNPIQAVAMIGLKKFAQNNIGNVAQYLYNLNNNPLSPIDKKGAGFIKKGNNNASNLSLNSIVNNPSSVADSSEIDTSNLEVGDNPLDTIPDRNVGVNPTDTVISENVNETAGNQAQELYNQGDENLSPNSEQMETTKKTTKKKSTKKGKKGDIKWYADEAYSPEIVMTEGEINKWEEKNGTNDTDNISLKRDLIDKLMKKGNYGEKVKVIIRKNGEMAGTHTIEKFQGDGKTYYNIDVGTPDWEVFDVKDMKNWLINNDTVYAEMGGEKYTTPEYSKWEEERNAQIEKEREESGIAEQERKISNNLLSKIGDKGTIERFKEYFKGELAKNGGKYDMYKDILAFLEGKKTVDDFVEGEIVINDFPNSVMKEIRENLGLDPISIKNLHSMIKEYGKIDKSNNKTKQYADNSYKPSITMKIDMNKEIIKTIKDMNIWDKLGFVDKFNRKGVLERTNEGYEYHFLNDTEEGSSPFPTVLSDMDIIGFTEPYYGAADPDYSDILSPKETKQEKSTTKNASIDELIDEVWEDIGDEGDWDWYKKMKKKDVIGELEDYVMDRMGEAEKSYGANYGIGWSEVQKKIKKFVNQKMK